MNLAEIRLLCATIDDGGRSPVADAVAAAWGYPAGAARHRRSSASHVFIAGDCYLRFVPAGHRQQADLAQVALLMRELGERGAAVVQPVPASSGTFAEAVQTPLGPYQAMAVRAAPGGQVEVDMLTTTQATEWGTALARLHQAGADVGAVTARLPGPFADLGRAAEEFADDPPLAEAITRLIQLLDELPRDRNRFGVIHGDFELDNICWAQGRAVAYDLDEAAHSWYLADIAHATRDLAEAQDLFDAFLAGYRQVSALTGPDLALLPLFTAANAACSAVRALSALDHDQPGEPPWLSELRRKLRAYIRRQRQTVITLTH